MERPVVVDQEEIFGPVVIVMPYSTMDEAISTANDSEYGLGGGVFTSNIERGLSVASQPRTGSCVINDGLLAGGGGPFGGYKKSGIGREAGPEGVANYYQLSAAGDQPQPVLVAAPIQDEDSGSRRST
jgi:aldehyde dehydrogenase (NAD+)